MTASSSNSRSRRYSSVAASREQTCTFANGCAEQNADSTRDAVVDAVGTVPSRSVPVIPDRTASTSALNAACSASIRLAHTTNRSPSRVRPSKLCPRLIRVTLSSRSSLAIAEDSAGCDT
ncbi:Uncharacterised protein [Mycobacterium tuberculosis]|nr:Uncharacterised protein [Mycobacterium tuberculosis]COW98455.1 Uncharacterised protein [Mycobacterium tuberculosis]